MASCAIPAPRLEEPFKVLILGDSISIGYTQEVREILGNRATVIRPTHADTGKPENCAGTTYGKDQIDRWLGLEGGDFDIVHFNFGLHDLKRMHPETGKGSNRPEDPPQAALEVYASQLRHITSQLKTSGARLVFATTTPVPESKVSPHRDPEDVVRYNDAARALMAEFDVPVDDLYAFALPRLAAIQRPSNVHFTPEGSRTLAEQVAGTILKAATSPPRGP